MPSSTLKLVGGNEFKMWEGKKQGFGCEHGANGEKYEWLCRKCYNEVQIEICNKIGHLGSLDTCLQCGKDIRHIPKNQRR